MVPKGDYLFCADSFQKNENPFKGNTYSGIAVKQEIITKKYKENEVYHFTFKNNMNNLLNETYDKYAEIMSCALKSYTRSNSRKYKLILENMKAGDKEFQQQFEDVVKKQLETFIKKDNAIYPQFEGYDLQEMTTQHKDKDSKDFIQLRQDTFEMVATSIKMPIKMLYGDMNNVEEVINQFLTFTIDLVAKLISEEITRKSISYEDWEKGDYIQVDTTNINHIDILNIGEKVDKLIASGTTNIDEIRTRIGLNKLNTDFSKQFWITKNYDTVENLLKSILKGGGNDAEEK